ncbi:MAG: tandem-95 repeat protein [Phycisphaerales bacterium]|nr:MAG: tandem-95 repeat protein [Phycisphaerales bacterium]
MQSITQPQNGETEIIEGSVRYTPDPDFYGVDTFTYTISDGRGGTDTATVTLTVTPVNDPPVAVDDAAVTDEDTQVTIDVLANDSDVDGDPLTVQSITQPEHGATEIIEGSVRYTPDPDFSGEDHFTYTIADGQGGTDTATVTVNVNKEVPGNQSPVAQIAAPDRGYPGQSISFDGSASYDSDGRIISYDFDFGDGTGYVETESGAPDSKFDGLAVHSYQQEGVYTVTLTVTDDDGATDTTARRTTIGECPCVGGEYVMDLIVEDIGGPDPHGQITEDPQPGDFTIKAAGADIWGTSDQFSYAYTVNKLKGDFTAVVRVEGPSGGDTWAKAGIMVRESRNPEAAHAMVITSGGEGVHMQGRHDTGGESWTKTLGPHADEPVWLSLSRNGNRFTSAYKYSAGDAPTEWTDCVSADVDLPDEVYIGLATTSHAQHVPATAVYSQFCIGPPHPLDIAGPEPPLLPPRSANMMIRELIDSGEVWDQITCRQVLAAGTGTFVDYEAPVLNISDSPGAGGYFGNDDPFGVVTAGYRTPGSVDNLRLYATGRVQIHARGDYTFGVRSDDGFTLQFPGYDFHSPVNGEILNFAGGAALAFNDCRPAAATLGVLTLPAGCHEFRLWFHEHEFDAEVEFFAAEGFHAEFDPDVFGLVGDPGRPSPGVDTCEPPYAGRRYDLHASAGFEFETQSGGKHTVRLDGPMRAEVYWEGDSEGDAQDDDGDGLDEIKTEIKTFILRGDAERLGQVEGKSDPDRLSAGEIEEVENHADGMIDLPPFAGGTGTGVLILNAQLDVGDITLTDVSG